MRFALRNKATHALIVTLTLLAFSLRALIPQGFMPASDQPLSVQICPDGFPTQLLTHAAHHHSGGHWQTEHCVFGSACAAGPAPHLPSLSYISFARYVPVSRYILTVAVVQVVYLPQPRGPPLV